jgi:hypothetical protein
MYCCCWWVWEPHRYDACATQHNTHMHTHMQHNFGRRAGRAALPALPCMFRPVPIPLWRMVCFLLCGWQTASAHACIRLVPFSLCVPYTGCLGRMQQCTRLLCACASRALAALFPQSASRVCGVCPPRLSITLHAAAGCMCAPHACLPVWARGAFVHTFPRHRCCFVFLCPVEVRYAGYVPSSVGGTCCCVPLDM